MCLPLVSSPNMGTSFVRSVIIWKYPIVCVRTGDRKLLIGVNLGHFYITINTQLQHNTLYITSAANRLIGEVVQSLQSLGPY